MAITQPIRLDLSPDSFTRRNDTGDIEFCSAEGCFTHFDPVTALTLQQLLVTIINTENPAVLDLVAGEDSFIDDKINPQRLAGVGPAAGAMQRNEALSERVVQDLNKDPNLPLPDATFDVVLISGDVPYLKRPVELFREASRVLKPGGQLIVSVSTEYRNDRVIKFWRRGGEDERLALVNHYFELSEGFDEAQVRLCPPRPGGRAVIVTFAAKPGGLTSAKVLPPSPKHADHYSAEEIAERKSKIGETMRCPYCDIPLTKFKVPDGPFCEWDAEYMWVCFEESCPFTLRSLEVMREQGNMGVAYRLMYDREKNITYTVPDVSFCDRG